METYTNFRYIIVPFLTWFGIQTFKVIWDLVTTKKFNFKRILGAGGMPSSHSAVVIALATMIGRSEGVSSPIFALSMIFALIVIYDATGIRRTVGIHAQLLNKMIEEKQLIAFKGNKLVEQLGHTPRQVLVGIIIGLIIGTIF